MGGCAKWFACVVGFETNITKRRNAVNTNDETVLNAGRKTKSRSIERLFMVDWSVSKK